MTVKLSKHISKNNIELPSDTIIRQSQKEVTTTDALGRTLVIKRPGWLKQSNFLRSLGKKALNDNGEINSAYFNSISSIMFVKSVDGVPVTLNNDVEIDRWINELDIEGKDAVEKCLVENFILSNEQEVKEEIKK